MLDEFQRIVLQNNKLKLLFICLIVDAIALEFNFIAVATIVSLQGNLIEYMIYIMIWCIVPSLFGVPIGIIIDTFDKRKIIFVSLLLSSICECGFVLSYKFNNRWIMYTTVGIFYVINDVTTTTFSALVPAIVEKEKLLAVNVYQSIISKLFTILGCTMGGLILYFTSISTNLYANIALYLLSALLFSRIFQKYNENVLMLNINDDIEKQTEKNDDICEQNENVFEMAINGIKYICKNKNIYTMIIIKSLVNLMFGSIFMINYNNAYNVFATNTLDSIKIFAIANVVESVFVFITQYAIKKFCDENIVKMKQCLLLGFIFVICSTIFFAFEKYVWLWWIGNGVFMAGNIIFGVIVTVILQKESSLQMQGRVFANGLIIRTFMIAIGVLYSAMFIQYNIVSQMYWMIGMAIFYICVCAFFLINEFIS